jgi:hypothetical protein
MCFEVFGPSENVLESTRHVLIFPGDFRLDQVKFYSPNPAPVPLKVQVTINGVDLFSYPLEMEDGVLSANRAAFDTDFDTGLIPSGAIVKVVIVDAPQYVYYETPWKGLTCCLNGVWLPHAVTARGILRRTPGTRPPTSGGGGAGEYPAGWIDMGDGTYVTDGEGNFVLES